MNQIQQYNYNQNTEMTTYNQSNNEKIYIYQWKEYKKSFRQNIQPGISLKNTF